MKQQDLFGFTGEELRDFGIRAAEHQRALAIQAVDKAIEYASWPGGPFTAESVRDQLGRYARDHEDISKVIGGRMRAAALRGDIYTTGETVKAHRPGAHSRRLLLWYRKSDIREVIA